MAETLAPKIFVDGEEWKPPPEGKAPPCTSCAEDEKKPPRKKMSPGVEKMIAGLPPEQQELVAKSPSLQAKLEKLNGEGWRVESVTSAGATASRGDQVIRLGPGTNNVGTLAHEAGHADYALPPRPSTSGLTEQQYVDAQVSQNFRDEGAAQFSRAQTRSEILANGGPDIGYGGRSTQYGAIWDQYSAGTITQDQAITRMGQQMGGEITSTTKQPYADYYGNGARNTYRALTGGK